MNITKPWHNEIVNDNIVDIIKQLILTRIFLLFFSFLDDLVMKWQMRKQF